MKSIIWCALVCIASGSAVARAGDCCDHCGCQACCRKVCRLVCETKKVPKITYSCECEDFCVPGPSTRCVERDCECGKRVVYTPNCAQVRTRKKLVKHETMEEKKSYKWVVETVCDSCACRLPAEQSAQLKPDEAAHSNDYAATSAAPTRVAVNVAAEAAEARPKSTLRRVFGLE